MRWLKLLDQNFTIIKRPNIILLKEKLEHVEDKQFCSTRGKQYPVDLIIGNNIHCKIKAKEVFKEKSNEHVVEGTTLSGLSMVVIVQLMSACSRLTFPTARNYTVWMFWGLKT